MPPKPKKSKQAAGKSKKVVTQPAKVRKGKKKVQASDDESGKEEAQPIFSPQGLVWVLWVALSLRFDHKKLYTKYPLEEAFGADNLHTWTHDTLAKFSWPDKLETFATVGVDKKWGFDLLYTHAILTGLSADFFYNAMECVKIESDSTLRSDRWNVSGAKASESVCGFRDRDTTLTVQLIASNTVEVVLAPIALGKAELADKFMQVTERNRDLTRDQAEPDEAPTINTVPSGPTRRKANLSQKAAKAPPAKHPKTLLVTRPRTSGRLAKPVASSASSSSSTSDSNESSLESDILPLLKDKEKAKAIDLNTSLLPSPPRRMNKRKGKAANPHQTPPPAPAPELTEDPEAAALDKAICLFIQEAAALDASQSRYIYLLRLRCQMRNCIRRSSGRKHPC
ncbi:hypothetical protein B0H17DRAFT_1146863 [Mycena rosella]|uniref:Uncharacterized protein n=1 Tax=Mycena rosella TaxID=1033263 RepID=A0AAD7CMW3_MYCRO|nr:hypothetical protein B0H17DRAFT_1146863 [Mycena rosella]